MTADQLLARFTIEEPTSSEHFLRTLASADPLCKITTRANGLIEVLFADGSILLSHNSGKFEATHPGAPHA